jgi:hypothetical protein
MRTTPRICKKIDELLMNLEKNVKAMCEKVRELREFFVIFCLDLEK